MKEINLYMSTFRSRQFKLAATVCTTCHYLLIVSWLTLLLGCSPKPMPVILDTDIAPDFDDVGAMALLHSFADAGEVKILGTVSCNSFQTTGPTLSVLNTYFNRAEIPIGVSRAEKPNMACGQKWAEAIIEKYPHALKKNEEAWDAVKLYRKLLASETDKSVIIITTGFFTNMAKLLDSKPDKFSKLNGKQLVEQKVKQLVSMAAGIGEDGKSFREYNVLIDAPAAKKVFSEWPKPVLLSGFEIGKKILTGIPLISNESIKNSPVKDAYQIALSKDNNLEGRNSWDQTAVLVAVRGIQPYFNSVKVNFEIKDDGTNTLIPGEKFEYLREKMAPAEVAKIIENLMMHQPKKTSKE